MMLRPTARAVALVLAIVTTLYVGWTGGARSLNAIVVPLLVVAVAAAVAVVRAEPPAVDRRPIRPGCVGETRRVELVASADRPTPATVRDSLGVGLSPASPDDSTSSTDADSASATAGTDTPRSAGDGPPPIETTIGAETTVAYDVRLDERGERTVGPAAVTVRDVFGLFGRRFVDDGRASVLVYPRVHALVGIGGRELAAVAAADRLADRGEFDHLREYRRGDSLRDVDWKATARRSDDEPIVAARATEEPIDRVTVLAEAAPGGADAMATAAASVAIHFLERDVGVTLVLPEGSVDADPSSAGRRRALSALARVGPGRAEAADRWSGDGIRIRGAADGTTVVLGDREVSFDRLRSDRGAGGIDGDDSGDRGSRGTPTRPSRFRGWPSA